MHTPAPLGRELFAKKKKKVYHLVQVSAQVQVNRRTNYKTIQCVQREVFLPPITSLLFFLFLFLFHYFQLVGVMHRISRKVRSHLVRAQEKSLSSLSLREESIEQCPREIASCVPLRTLDLSINKLAFLPPEIDRLVNLKTLVLRRNYFAEFPHPVLSLQSLETLDISFNQLSFLSEDLSLLSSLNTLDVSHNTLEALPRAIGAMRKTIRNIHATHNKVQTLPMELGQCVELHVLDLEGNPLMHPLDKLRETGTAAILHHLRLEQQTQQESTAIRKKVEEGLAMDELEFKKLHRSVSSEPFPDLKFDIAKKSIPGNFFTSQQVALLVGGMSYSHWKEALAVEMYRTVLDRGKYFHVMDKLEFAESKIRVQQELHLGVQDSQANGFDPDDPSGYYRLQLIEESNREIVQSLRELEMKNIGENLKLVKWNGSSIDLFDLKGIEIYPQRNSLDGVNLGKSVSQSVSQSVT
jgi:hypothetical protein